MYDDVEVGMKKKGALVSDFILDSGPVVGHN